MIVKTLLENTALTQDLGCEHGLSLHFKTKMGNILFDTGRTGLFADNAAKMGLNLAAVDLLVISHGHSDHGGGIETFLKLNEKAKVYVNSWAFEEHCSRAPDGGSVDIGLDRTLLPNPRLVFVEDRLRLGSGLELFSRVRGEKFNPSGNRVLMMKDDDVLVPDDFAHEQNLIIEEDGKSVLVAGCAHAGIVNILERFQALKGFMPTHVIGGFHLTNPSTGVSDSDETIEGIARFLLSTNAWFCTGHCTGAGAYAKLKALMGERIDFLSSGKEFVL